jgi:hypothetical protein
VLANNGALVEGPVHLWASCGTHEKIGTFALFARGVEALVARTPQEY